MLLGVQCNLGKHYISPKPSETDRSLRLNWMLLGGQFNLGKHSTFLQGLRRLTVAYDNSEYPLRYPQTSNAFQVICLEKSLLILARRVSCIAIFLK